MTAKPIDSSRLASMRLAGAWVLAASLAACGGGGGSSGDGGAPPAPPPPPPPPPPPASRCIDPTPAATSTVKFATPTAPTASSVEISTNGLSACFLGAAAAGAKSDVAAAQGEASFYYFELTRSQLADVSFGVSATAEAVAPAGGFVPRSDTLVVSGEDLVTVDAAGATRTNNAGSGQVFGFAVDLRVAYPVVSVIAPASVNTVACSGLAPSTPCVILRWQFATPASALSIYAYGSGDGTTGPRVSINTGSDQTAKPYAYGTASVLAALRASRLQGERGFNPQWPAAGGPASLPTLTRVGSDRAVVRQDDSTPYRSAFEVTPSNAAGGSIGWKDEAGAPYANGASLTLSPLAGTLAVGEHVLTASVVNPQTGRYGETTFRLRVVATGDDADHDGDGLSYDQEKAAGLDPGNADSDGDGLSDGAETGLGKNPLVADNTEADAALPRRGMLVHEPGATSQALVVLDDGLSVVFGDALNPACVQHVAPFDDPVYSGSSFGPLERCEKRAIRANVGIHPGEFRYFESRRLDPEPRNIGHGLMVPAVQIDPYCCYIDPNDPDYPIYSLNNPTPPSMGLNSVGGVFVKLQAAGAGFGPDLHATVHYGFAVDYPVGGDPVVFVVARDSGGSMIVSPGLTVSGFTDRPAMPMLYGHRISETQPQATVNLGLQQFHYDLTAVRAALTAQGANGAALTPGVGAHRWP